MFLFSTAAQAQSANQSSEAVAAGLEKEVSSRSSMATEAYLRALLELASTNLVGPAAEVEKQIAITISKRTQLVGILGSTAVANIDKQYPNLFTDEFRKHNSDLATLSDACLANSEEAKALRFLVDSTSNPILTFLAHAPPFRWEAPSSGTSYAAECRYCNADSGKSDVPAYLLPRIKSKNKTGFNQSERVIVWQCSRNTANLLQDAYKKYVSSATEFKSHADSEVESNSPTIDEALVQQNRQSLVALCGEAAVADLDERRSLYTPDLFKQPIQEVPFDDPSPDKGQKSQFFERSYRNYLASLQKLAAINLTGPAEAVETQTVLTLEQRSKLVDLAGDTAVAKLDMRFKNLFSQEFRKRNPELALLLDAYLSKNADEKSFFEEHLGSSVPNPLILLLSHSHPFYWDPSMMWSCGFALPQFVVRWIDELKHIDTIPAYLRPPTVKGESGGTVLILIRLYALKAADKVTTAYHAYCSSISNSSMTPNKSSDTAGQLSARLNWMQIKSNRKLLVKYCGEEAVSTVDVQKNFVRILKESEQFE
ncbi:MAG: hypothetical protein U0103_15190 [Candidatus Obscuribacterales bacterium]